MVLGGAFLGECHALLLEIRWCFGGLALISCRGGPALACCLAVFVRGGVRGLVKRAASPGEQSGPVSAFNGLCFRFGTL